MRPLSRIIYGLIKIMNAKDLPYFILENVKGLINHDKGRTFKIILEELDKAGYRVFYKVLNSLALGVPQMRERIYFVGIRKDLPINEQCFKWPEINISRINLKDCLIDDDPKLEFDERNKSYETFLRYLDNKYNKGLFDIKELLKEDYLVLDTRQSDLRLYRDKVPTLRTGRHGVLYVRYGKFRKLSGFESLLLQGFSKHLANKIKGKINESLLLSQTGNAMTVNAIKEIGESLLTLIGSDYERERTCRAGFANSQAGI
jgi:DNA (cytosine-5)-methyltransferase 1